MTTVNISCSTADALIVSNNLNYTTAHDASSADSITVNLLLVGQALSGGDYDVYRNGIIINTTSIPITALINSAKARFKVVDDLSSTDFLVTVVSGTDLTDTIVVADYGDLLNDTTSFGSLTTAGVSLVDWNDINLNATGLVALQAAVTSGDKFRFGIRSSRDISSTTPTGLEWISCNTFPPVELEVTYNLPPTVTTQTCKDLSGSTATARGTIVSSDPNITEHGHVWATTVNPTTADSKVQHLVAGFIGVYQSAVTGLTPGTAYYVRAYAINTAGTSYGDNVYFVASTGKKGTIWMEGSNLHGFDQNAVERIYIHTDDVDDTPVDAATTAPVSSNWAYDHVAAADPHTVYRLESADHSHQSTGLQAGQLDHGLAMTAASLLDDDHTQYALDTDLTTHAAVTTGIHGLDAKAPLVSPTFATSITGSYLTASEILITDGSKNIISAAVATYPSLTELSYVKGLSSAIQTQLNGKAATLAGTINEISYFNSASTIASLAVATYPSLTELSYVKGVTSALQTQLGLKAPLASPTFTGNVNLANLISSGNLFYVADNGAYALNGGTDNNSGRIELWGKSNANLGLIALYTPNAALAATLRFILAGGANTVVGTWASMSHSEFKLTASQVISPVSGFAGFSVHTSFGTIGSAGSMIIPHADMGNAANDAARDALAGNVNGTIAIDSAGVAGVYKFWCRTNAVWKSVVIT
mgnify:CR=1 FL=1